MSKLVFGCGYLGQRIAKRWRDAGAEVHVVTRSHQRAAHFRRDGYRAIVADVTRPETLRELPQVETVLFSVGFDHGTSSSIEEVYVGGIKNVLAELSTETQHFLYLSTTGVYGSAHGDWVDEQTPPNPQRDGARASLAAEQQLASNPLGSRSILLRMAGIYGPRRIPYINKLRAGQPIAAPSEGWLNLIHVDDAASIALAAETWAKSGNLDPGPHVFCVSDGQPVVRGDYYQEVARRIGASPPKFVSPDPHSPAAQRAMANKRIRTEKMRQMLGAKLAYPSYREGLAAILGSANLQQRY